MESLGRFSKDCMGDNRIALNFCLATHVAVCTNSLIWWQLSKCLLKRAGLPSLPSRGPFCLALWQLWIGVCFPVSHRLASQTHCWGWIVLPCWVVPVDTPLWCWCGNLALAPPAFSSFLFHSCRLPCSSVWWSPSWQSAQSSFRPLASTRMVTLSKFVCLACKPRLDLLCLAGLIVHVWLDSGKRWGQHRLNLHMRIEGRGKPVGFRFFSPVFGGESGTERQEGNGVLELPSDSGKGKSSGWNLRHLYILSFQCNQWLPLCDDHLQHLCQPGPVCPLPFLLRHTWTA